MPSTVRISGSAPWEASVGYSRAVRAGNSVHVAGTTAAAPDGSAIAPGDVYGQSVAALEMIERALRAAGATINDVVRTRIYITDISRWQEAGRAHGEVFRDVRPALTMVEVSRLISPDFLVEIEADAVVTES